MFSKKFESLTNETDILKIELKAKLLEIFSGGLGRCTKMFAKLELQENVTPVFKRKRNVLFASLGQINDELDKLESMGARSKVAYCKRCSPVIYVKKKTKEIRVCADLLMR